MPIAKPDTAKIAASHQKSVTQTINTQATKVMATPDTKVVRIPRRPLTAPNTPRMAMDAAALIASKIPICDVVMPA